MCRLETSHSCQYRSLYPVSERGWEGEYSFSFSPFILLLIECNWFNYRCFSAGWHSLAQTSLSIAGYLFCVFRFLLQLSFTVDAHTLVQRPVFWRLAVFWGSFCQNCLDCGGNKLQLPFDWVLPERGGGWKRGSSNCCEMRERERERDTFSSEQWVWISSSNWLTFDREEGGRGKHRLTAPFKFHLVYICAERKKLLLCWPPHFPYLQCWSSLNFSFISLMSVFPLFPFPL